MAITFAKGMKKGTQAKTEPKVTKGTIQKGGAVSGVGSTTATEAKTKAATVKKTPVTPTVDAGNVDVQALKTKLKPLAKELLAAKSAADTAKKAHAKLDTAQKAVATKILKAVAESGVDDSLVLEVTKEDADLRVSAGATTRTINNMRDVFKQLEKVDKDLPWQLMKFTLTDIDKYLPPKTIEMLVTEAQTSKRTVTVKSNE
ncbi:hypothetical protein [Vibrio phage LV6]|nr:hypothetical protein [Vibrio phage LV6]